MKYVVTCGKHKRQCEIWEDTHPPPRVETSAPHTKCSALKCTNRTVRFRTQSLSALRWEWMSLYDKLLKMLLQKMITVVWQTILSQTSVCFCSILSTRVTHLRLPHVVFPRNYTGCVFFLFVFLPLSHGGNCLSRRPLVTSRSRAMHLNRIIFRFLCRVTPSAELCGCCCCCRRRR